MGDIGPSILSLGCEASFQGASVGDTGPHMGCIIGKMGFDVVHGICYGPEVLWLVYPGV